MNDLDAKAREIAAGLNDPERRLAAKRIRSELAYMAHGGRGARGKISDAAVARLTRVLVRSLGEKRSVTLGLALWVTADGADIGLGSPLDRDASPTDLGRAVARVLSEGGAS